MVLVGTIERWESEQLAFLKATEKGTTVMLTCHAFVFNNSRWNGAASEEEKGGNARRKISSSHH